MIAKEHACQKKNTNLKGLTEGSIYNSPASHLEKHSVFLNIYFIQFLNTKKKKKYLSEKAQTDEQQIDKLGFVITTTCFFFFLFICSYLLLHLTFRSLD